MGPGYVWTGPGCTCKIRTTINSYADKAGTLLWYEGFKYPTLLALARRLKQYEQFIEHCSHIEAHLAYKQLDQRLTSLLNLFKNMKVVGDAQDLMQLPIILPPLDVIISYLKATKQKLAPDLFLAYSYADFFKKYRSSVPIEECVQALDISALRLAQEEVQKTFEENSKKSQGKRFVQRTLVVTTPRATRARCTPNVKQEIKDEESESDDEAEADDSNDEEDYEPDLVKLEPEVCSSWQT